MHLSMRHLLLPDSQPCANGIGGRVGSVSKLVVMVVVELTEVLG